MEGGRGEGVREREQERERERARARDRDSLGPHEVRGREGGREEGEGGGRERASEACETKRLGCS